MKARIVMHPEGHFCVGRWSGDHQDWVFYMGHVGDKEYVLDILKNQFNWGWEEALMSPGEILAKVARERYGP